MNEECKQLDGMKDWGIGIQVKKDMYGRVLIPTVMYGSELWCSLSIERQVKVFEMKCLMSMTALII